MKKFNRVTVADYLNQQIAYSGKSQVEIAEACGYTKPNIITMFKQGLTKLPINKVPQMAKAIGVDPIHLLAITMEEYSPETWETLQSLLGKNLVSDGEMKVLEVMRSVANGQQIEPEGVEDIDNIEAIFSKWRERSDERVRATMERAEREKREKRERKARSEM